MAGDLRVERQRAIGSERMARPGRDGFTEGEGTRHRPSRRELRALMRLRALLFLGEMKHAG